MELDVISAEGEKREGVKEGEVFSLSSMRIFAN